MSQLFGIFLNNKTKVFKKFTNNESKNFSKLSFFLPMKIKTVKNKSKLAFLELSFMFRARTNIKFFKVKIIKVIKKHHKILLMWF